MESGERLTSQAPSATPSSPTFSANSVASVVPKRNLSSGGTAITSCGHLFRASGDQLFNLSTVSSAFSMVSHPIFGLHAAGSGHSEFGGLGTLRAPAALSAHPHLSPFPEWWRTAEAHARAGSTFYPPLLGMQPIFSTSTQTHDNASFHAKNAGKEGRGVAEEGVNGVINGNSATTSSSVNCTSAITTPSSSVPVKSITSGGSSRKYNQDQNQLHDGKMKEKKSRKDAVESSSNSDSDSDSSSDTSSEGITSSDSDDLEEDQSIEESDDSDSETETEAQHKKTTVLMHCVTDLKTDGRKSTEKTQERTTHQQIPLLSDPQTPTAFHSQQKQTQVMSQQLPFVFQSSQVKEESVNKHTSVIQSTGLVTNVNLLGPQDKKEANLKLLTSSETTKAGNKITSEESNISTSDMRTKRDKVEQTLPVQLKKTPDVSKHQKKATLISSDSKPECSSMSLQKHSSSENSHSNPFLTNALLGKHQPNGVIHCLSQDVPLALTTSKSQCTTNESMLSSISTHFYSPLNLTCTKKMSTNVTPVVRSTSSEVQSLGKEKSVCNKITTVKTQPPLHAAKSLVDHFRRIDSDIASSKGSDESNEEEEEEEEEEDEEDDDDDDDSDDSHSGSASNSESDTEGSDDEEDEDDDKDPEESDSDTEGEKTPLKLNKTAPSLKSSSTDPAVHSTPLNLKITNTPGSAPAALCTEFQSLAYFANSSPLTTSTPCGTDKRRRVIDQRALHIPLEYGWQRETRIRNITGRLQGEVSYFAPCGKKLRQYPEVMKYLSRNGIMDISRDNFSFSAKVRVGDFYEARDGQQGMEWCLLKEEEVVPRIRAMEGRRGRPPNPERQRTREHSRMRHRKGRPPNVSSPEFVGNNDAKMLRKIQAQEIARQAAQIKLLRKLQKQEQTRAAKEAKKQQAIMVAEEKRKQKEQIKILRQQEKIKRIQQIRVEKELRAQQILEEKELRRQQAIILKHQELERHRLDMVWERERRRQHVMLMKAMDARKKTEEKERLKQEKRDEKRINKERKLELRRLELEMAKALKKPTEDMCLGDQKPLPDLHRIPGLILSGSTFSDCLMVVQFLRNFGKVLGFDLNTDVPNLRVLQEGLINLGSSLDEVQDLLVRLLSSAVCDPGLPSGYKAKTALGEHLINIGINRDNVSEILQIFMEAHSGQTEFTESLKTKAFQAHSPSEKASVLAFLVNELACSKCVVSEIDKSIDYMSNLRKDKWMVEGRLRKLKTIHALKTGKKDTSLGDEVGDGQHLLGTPSPGHKHGRKLGDSDYDDEDDDDDDSEDPADEDEEDEEDKDDKKGKRIDPCEDEDDDDEETASVEELEKQIEKLLKQQGQFRKKLFEASHSLRSMMFGQDRYRRRYWILPQCGGVFVEGMESGEGLEEVAKERERQKKGESIQMKEESSEISEEKLNCLHVNKWEQIQLKEKGNTNLFLQKPGSFSKLSKLLEAAKMSSESDSLIHKTNGSSTNGCTLPYHDKKNTIHNIQQSSSEISECNLFTPIASGAGKFYNCSTVPSDQLLKTLTETNRQWFNLLPRTPCDGTLVMRTDLPAMPSSMTSHSQSHSPSPIPSPNLCSISSQNPMGLSQCTLSPLQMKTGLTMMGLQLCGWPTSMLTSNLPFASPIPCLGSELELADGNGHSFVTDIIAFNKSESPLSQNESSACTPATVEVAKAVDYPSPKPIPEDMQFGWWRMSDPEELKALLKVLHLRGIREKSLQKQIQKHLEYITHACFRNKDDIIEINENEGNHITCDILKNWSVEDQAMEIDIALLQQVEDLERRVASASLQMKGWIYPEPSSEREDLVYYEHKTVSKLKMELEGQHGGEDGGNVIALERKSDNPLDIAVTRLTELERNIERRYLKSPLSTTIQIKLDNVGTVTVPAPAPSISGDGDGIEDDIAPGLRVWRKALSEARSAAQVSLCIQQLNRSIAWEKSIMKVYCQLCRKGDNEELLLLCDGCDKGCHTYCHKPKITTIPEGDWFCPACIAKASGQSPKIKKGKRSNEQKRSRSLSLTGDIEDEDPASLSSPVKKGGKDPKKRKIDENNSINLLKQESSPSSKKPKTAKDASKDLTTCSMILSEMETHQDAWPFLLPVNLKLVPGYKKVIKKPMDFSTIREKLSSGQYSNLQAFALDIRLVFNNCETFNEDDSDIGRAGHNMRIYFENKWTEMFKVS
ncbi:bromodomain adjacent to zinc finger domain protein 2B isoform X4 [Ambystoma mexicanum]|uniref:bromodomain adjacent to zinc finger domain protein 2B isoform X4 n=1 Tax=Ambystoma mexicanum TaxID=8296 RepID=UPI0037E7C56A